jgi:hypothetical protein
MIATAGEAVVAGEENALCRSPRSLFKIMLENLNEIKSYAEISARFSSSKSRALPHRLRILETLPRRIMRSRLFATHI